jgi:putative peptidoglycan lipid II flippase
MLMGKENERPVGVAEEGIENSSKASFLARAAFVVMAATLLSRVFGLAREMVMSTYFGARTQIDAYRVAFLLPNLFRMLLADAAIASAFIPVFSSYLAKKDKQNAWKVASTVINMMILFLIVFLGLGMIFSRQLIPILAPGFAAKAQTMDLAVLMTRVMFPSILLVALAGVVMGILNSYDHFAAPAVAPVLWNILIIGSVVLLAPRIGVVSLAVGVTLGSLVQLVFQLPFLKGRETNYSLILDWRHPGVKQVGALLVPVIISLAALDINAVVDTRFASTLVTGSVASLGYAQRLWMLPLGMFAIAISTVLFPTLSRQAALEDLKAMKESLSLGIRVILMIVLPASVGLMVLGIPIIRLILQQGRFVARDTIFTASALFHYSVGLFAAGELYIVNRAYYSLKDTRTPMIVAAGAIVVNYFGDWLFMIYLPVIAKAIHLPKSISYLGLAHGGIALSTSLVCILNFLVLVWILKVRLKGIDGMKIAGAGLKALFASAVLGLAAFYSRSYTAQFFGVSKAGQGAAILIAILAGMLVYLGLLMLLRADEVKVVYELVSHRTGKGNR